MKPWIKRVGCLAAAALMLAAAGCAPKEETPPSSGEEKETTLKVVIKKDPVIVHTKESTPNFSASGLSKLQVWTETSPTLYEVGGIRRACITNNKTVSFNLIDGKTVLDKDHFDPNSGLLATWPNIITPDGKRYLKPEEVERWDMWKTVYYGLFTAWSDDTNTYAIVHGENKNMMIDGEGGAKIRYNNTVKRPDTEYGDDEYSYGDKDNWDNYFAFLCSAYGGNAEVAATGNLLINDNGPIIWPDNGYLDELEYKISSGPRHPCTIIHDGYIYIYYLLEMQGSPAIKAARAPVSGNAMPGTFYKYYNGEFSEPALPEGFDKNDRSFVYKMSGMSSKIIESGNPIQFAVAHLKDTPYFVGILEETGTGGVHYLSISASKDLVNWTTPQRIEQTVSESWEMGNLHYPKIYSRDFTSCMEVDKDGFYVTGTSSAYGGWLLPQYMPLVIDIIEE